MSATHSYISAFAVPREEARAEASFDDKLAEAAARLLAGGDVAFKLSTRKQADALPRARRALYGLLRLLPGWLFVPPALAMQRGVYDRWGDVLGECTGPDDQVLVMPRNRAYQADSWDVAVECRPLDPQDARRFVTLAYVFRDYEPAPLLPPGLAEAVAELEEVARTAKDA